MFGRLFKTARNIMLPWFVPAGFLIVLSGYQTQSESAETFITIGESAKVFLAWDDFWCIMVHQVAA
jgi:hypothetical protein